MGMRVLLAEGRADARSALRLLLEQEQGIDLVVETARAGDLLAQAEEVKPDTLLLDWALPGLQCCNPLPALRARFPDLWIVALSGRPEARSQALGAGVDAFVSKGEPPELLLRALRVAGVAGDGR